MASWDFARPGRRRHRRVVALGLVVAIWAGAGGAVLHAQIDGGGLPAADANPGAPGAAAPPWPDEPQTHYRAEGRRDPFLSLLYRGVEPVIDRSNLSGLKGLLTSEVSVRGVLESRGEFIAMVQGPDTKTHIAHVDDHLLDGVITEITPNGLVILQEVNDPLSLVRQREVRKSLRIPEGAR